MLNAMREGAKSGVARFILFGFMVLAVGGLVMMDVGGFFRNGVAPTSVAKIEGGELSLTVFDRTVRHILARQGMDAETAYSLGLIDQILDSEINQNLLQKAAWDLGLTPSDTAVLKEVNRILDSYVTEDMDRKTALGQLLRNQGLSEQDFVRMLKARLTGTVLQSAVGIGAEIDPGPETGDLYQYGNEKRTFKTVVLPHSAITDIQAPTDVILTPLYQAAQERYAIPEARTFSILILTADSLKDGVPPVSEEELRVTYEQDKAAFLVPERRVLRQAALESEAAAAAVAERVKNGMALKDAVKAETGEDSAFLGEGTFGRQDMADTLAPETFAAEKGGLVGPLQTRMGWHVLTVQDILPPVTPSFEDIRPALEKDLTALATADAMAILAQDLDTSLAGGTSLEEAAESTGTDIQAYGPVRQDGSTPDSKDGVSALGADSAAIMETVWTLLEGEVSPVTELGDGRYAAIRVDAVAPKSYRPFEEVRDDLAARWTQEQKEAKNRLRALDAVRALNNDDKALSDYGTIQTLSAVRKDDPPSPLDDKGKEMFFTLAEGEYGLAPVKDGFLVGQVATAILPDVSAAGDESLPPIRDGLRRSAQQEFLDLYMKHLRHVYSVRINRHLLDATYGPGKESL